VREPRARDLQAVYTGICLTFASRIQVVGIKFSELGPLRSRMEGGQVAGLLACWQARSGRASEQQSKNQTPALYCKRSKPNKKAEKTVLGLGLGLGGVCGGLDRARMQHWHAANAEGFPSIDPPPPSELGSAERQASISD
jgi:hypothetical protein